MSTLTVKVIEFRNLTGTGSIFGAATATVHWYLTMTDGKIKDGLCLIVYQGVGKDGKLLIIHEAAV